MTGEIRELETWAKQTFLYALIGVSVGIAIVGFFLALNYCTLFFLEFLGGYHPPSPRNEPHLFAFIPILDNALANPAFLLLLALIPALGGLICGIIKYKLLPVTKPELHETDVFIDAFHNEKGQIKAKDGLVRGICSVATISTGGSAGREGPSAMLGAMIGSLFGKFLKLDERERRKILSAAAGAGIAAMFRSPLGGAFFGIETLYRRDMEVDALVPAIICSIAAYIVSCTVFGFGNIYGIGDYDISSLLKPFSLILFLFLGIICVPFVIAFTKLLELSRSFFFDKIKCSDCFKPAIGGLLLGALFLIGYFILNPQHDIERGVEIASGIFGGGYGFIQLAFFGKITLSVLAFVAVAKILATALTMGSGGSGGSFIPSLAMGAAVGGVVGEVLSFFFPETVTSPWVFSLIGAAAFFGAAANAPLTSLFIVCEISGSYTLFVPALLAIIPAYSLVGRRTIYPGQYEVRKESPAHRREFMVDILEGIKVADAYTRDLLTLPGSKTVREGIHFAEIKRHITYPVVDEAGKLVGITSIMDMEEEREQGGVYKKINQMCRKDVVVAYPDEFLEDVLQKMDKYNVGRLPVVEREREKKLLGIISRSDIISEHCRRRSLIRDEAS